MRVARIPSARPRTSRRGVTLVELMVGVAIALFLTTAAIAFTVHETRLMGISRENLELSQTGRAALDLLTRDLAAAGAGVGYQTDGVFGGLRLDTFVIDGVTFNPAGVAVPVGSSGIAGAGADLALVTVGLHGSTGVGYVNRTQDIGVVFADGAYATISDYNAAGSGWHCLGTAATPITFRTGEIAIMRSEDGSLARTVQLGAPGVPGCSAYATCAQGCRAFTFVPAAPGWFASDPTADNATYVGGELQGGLKQVVWFVAAANGAGTLRRAVFDGAATCAARDNTCGMAAADFVEHLGVQVWTWDVNAGGWQSAGQVPINTPNRVRVDLELVVRARTSGARAASPVELRLLPGACVPVGDCVADRDFGVRQAFRTSVEVKNSGFLQMN